MTSTLDTKKTSHSYSSQHDRDLVNGPLHRPSQKIPRHGRRLRALHEMLQPDLVARNITASHSGRNGRARSGAHATSPLHTLRKVIVPDLHVHNVEPITVVVASRLHSEVQNVPGPDVHSPLDLLPVWLRVRIRVVCALQQRLRAPWSVWFETNDKVHAVTADGPHLWGAKQAFHQPQACTRASRHLCPAFCGHLPRH
jgi:hypothetical protein